MVATEPKQKPPKKFMLTSHDIIVIQAFRGAVMQTVGTAMKAVVEREWEIVQKLDMAESWRELSSWLAAYASLARELKADGAANKFETMLEKADKRALELESEVTDDVGDTKKEA